MKLLLCIRCQDIIRLFEEERVCKCGKVRGKYSNGKGIFSGDGAIPLLIKNNTLVRAIADQQDEGDGIVFDARVCPIHSADFKKKKTLEKALELLEEQNG